MFMQLDKGFLLSDIKFVLPWKPNLIKH